MSNFNCNKCGTAIIDSGRGYVTSCEHFKAEEVNKFRSKHIDTRCLCHAGKICNVHEDEVMKLILKERFKNRVVDPNYMDDLCPPNSIDDSPVDVKELVSKRFVVNNINDLIDKKEGIAYG